MNLLSQGADNDPAAYENKQLPEVVEMERCLAYGVVKRQ